MNRKVLVTIVRHGETDYNHAGVIQGHLDVPLNAQGQAQAAHTARWFRDSQIKFDRAYSSDLSRARLTAQLILKEQEAEITLIEDERIRERYLGNLQGKRRGDPGTDPSTVESASALRSRLFSFWDDLFPARVPFPPRRRQRSNEKESGPEQDDENDADDDDDDANCTPIEVLYVSHGAAIREFVQALVSERSDDYSLDDLPKGEAALLKRGEKRIGNCARTVIEMTPTRRTTRFTRDDPALDEGRGGGSTSTAASSSSTKEVEWTGRLLLYADDTHFIDSSRAPSPRTNADIL